MRKKQETELVTLSNAAVTIQKVSKSAALTSDVAPSSDWYSVSAKRGKALRTAASNTLQKQVEDAIALCRLIQMKERIPPMLLLMAFSEQAAIVIDVEAGNAPAGKEYLIVACAGGAHTGRDRMRFVVTGRDSETESFRGHGHRSRFADPARGLERCAVLDNLP